MSRVVLSIGAAVLIASCALAGCGGDDGPGSAPSTQPASSSASPPAASSAPQATPSTSATAVEPSPAVATAEPRALRAPSGVVPAGWSVRAVGGTALLYLPAEAVRGTMPNVADSTRPITTLTAVTDSAAYAVTWERYPAGTPEMRGPVADATLQAIVQNYVDVPELEFGRVKQERVVALGRPAIDVTGVDEGTGLDAHARVILLADGAVMLSAVADGRATAARAVEQLYDTLAVS